MRAFFKKSQGWSHMGKIVVAILNCFGAFEVQLIFVPLMAGSCDSQICTVVLRYLGIFVVCSLLWPCSISLPFISLVC